MRWRRQVIATAPLRCLVAVLAAAVLCAQHASAQVEARVGLRLGVTTSDLDTEEIRFASAGKDFGLALEEARYGYQGGLLLQLRAGNWIIQPEVLFNAEGSDYRLREFTDAGVISTLREERYQYLDVPLMLGYKVGPLRLQAGPVGHAFISSRSELEGVADYEAVFDNFSFGYQAGVGLDLWKVLLDFKYQGDVSGVGDHLRFGGRTVEFSERPGRLVIGVGWSFN